MFEHTIYSTRLHARAFCLSFETIKADHTSVASAELTISASAVSSKTYKFILIRVPADGSLSPSSAAFTSGLIVASNCIMRLAITSTPRRRPPRLFHCHRHRAVPFSQQDDAPLSDGVRDTWKQSTSAQKRSLIPGQRGDKDATLPNLQLRVFFVDVVALHHRVRLPAAAHDPAAAGNIRGRLSFAEGHVYVVGSSGDYNELGVNRARQRSATLLALRTTREATPEEGDARWRPTRDPDECVAGEKG